MSGTPPGAPPSAPRQGISALLLTVLFLAAAALLFYAIYLVFPAQQHFGALLLIGSLALVFAVACYLVESLSRDPAAQRSLAWAFMAMGFATLFLSVGLGNYYGLESVTSMLTGLIVLILLLIIAVAGIAWRMRAVAADRPREAARTAWRSEAPVSALSYSTANSPNVPATPPPATPAGGTTPPRSP
jgi:hypothetical protein